jgi:HEAT repeats
MPTPLPAGPSRSGADREQRRGEVYRELRQLEDVAVWALASALQDPDGRMRRNATLALGMLAGGYFVPSRPRMDIRDALPALIDALQDTDDSVRAWAAGAIGRIGPAAARAVPALVALLANPEEGSRNLACLALGGIGPPARDALPALRQALSDPSADVRRFAQHAIEIE